MDRFFFYIRITLLLALLGVSYVLYEWGKVGDPRFFAFLQTPAGAVVSELFGWDAVPLKRVAKTESEMTPKELVVKRTLEAEMGQSMPADRLLLRDGRTYEGHVVAEDDQSVVFEERYGKSGGMQFTISRKQIDRIEREAFSPPEISYRDVLFQMEFPDLKIFRRPPYTIATELEYFEVEKTIRELNRLYKDVVQTFHPAVGITNQMDSVQLLYFENEEDFIDHRNEHAKHLGYSSAYYSPSEDRFVMYHHSSSVFVKDAKRRVDQTGERYEQRNRGSNEHVRQWEDVEKNRIDSLARKETTRTLRHEGAHQLFYALGIHSHIRAENIWLVEGLAVYCEEQSLGRHSTLSANLVRLAVEHQGLVSFEDLINQRSLSGWGDLGARMSLELAYAQSWTAVHFLMQETYRTKFFNYMIHLRAMGADPNLIKRPRFEVLAENLDLTVVELEQQLQRYAKRI